MPTTTVSELKALLPQTVSRPDQVRLENVEVDEAGHSLVVTEDHFAEETNPRRTRYPLDALAERELATFLGISSGYLAKCPGDLKAINLNHWLHANAEAEAVLSIAQSPGGIDAGSIDAIYSPERVLLPVSRVAEVVPRVFGPDDEVVALSHDTRRVQIDVTSRRWQVDVPGNGIMDRPARGEVGDITSGGIRLWAPTDLRRDVPTVSTFLNRLVCTNGMVLPRTDRAVSLKGATVDDVLEELEHAAETLLAGLDEQLERYRHTAEVPVPGNHLAFIRMVGLDHKISRRVLDKALDYAAVEGPGVLGAEWTIFDVLNLFTSIANQVPFAQAAKLQRFGGTMVDQTEKIVHRCSQCERVIPVPSLD